MKIKIIVIGKTKENFLQIGEEEFRKRLQRYIDLEWIIIKQQKITGKSNESTIKAIEGNRIKEKIKNGEWIVALDSRANQMTSKELADFFLTKMANGLKCITFIIGGTLGLSENVFHWVDQKLSLSKMTLTHEMSRLLLLEQIYRAFTIIKGEKYHK